MTSSYKAPSVSFELPLIANYIGSGAFSEVFKVSRKSDGMTYALKKVSHFVKYKFLVLRLN